MRQRLTAALLLLLTPCMLLANVVDVPKELRTKNYTPYGQGSCVWASTVTALRAHGLDNTANWVRANYHSGASMWDIEDMLEISNVKYTHTDGAEDGNSYEECVAWMEWAMRNRHVCGITYKPSHVINIVGLTDTHAVLLDNNRPSRYEYIPRDEFFVAWYYTYGGYAWTFIHSPLPPWPNLVDAR